MTATAITKPMKAQQWKKKNYHEPKEAQFLTVLCSVNQSIYTRYFGFSAGIEVNFFHASF